jgi:homoserine kinase
LGGTITSYSTTGSGQWYVDAVGQQIVDLSGSGSGVICVAKKSKKSDKKSDKKSKRGKKGKKK